MTSGDPAQQAQASGSTETSEAPPGAPSAEETAALAASAQAPPLDHDDTRGIHLRALIRNPWVISFTITALIAGFVGGTLAAGAAVGGGGALAVLLLALLVIWLVAAGRAKEDFLNAYATARGLARQGRGTLPPATPLLRRGDDRYAVERMTGNLPGGEPGTLAHYTYEDTSTDSEGNRDTTYYHFTVCVCEVPESAHKVSELIVQRRFGFRFLDGFEDAFRSKRRVEVESEAMDKRFETFADPNADANWLRQLFAPSFIVWLSDHAPETFAFELVSGALVTNMKGHAKSAAELDSICEATSVVARRLRDEATEQPVGG